MNQQDLPHVHPSEDRFRLKIKLASSDPKVWLFIDSHKGFAASWSELMYQMEAEHLEEMHYKESLKEFINIIGGNLLNEVEDSDLELAIELEDDELEKVQNIEPECKLVASIKEENQSEEFVLTVLRY